MHNGFTRSTLGLRFSGFGAAAIATLAAGMVLLGACGDEAPDASGAGTSTEVIAVENPDVADSLTDPTSASTDEREPDTSSATTGSTSETGGDDPTDTLNTDTLNTDTVNTDTVNTDTVNSDPEAADPLAMPTPIDGGGPAVTIDDASQLIGRRIEDGVQWAETHDVTWRVLSYDGVPVDDDSPIDTTRISFEVDDDTIVRFEWS